MCCYHGPAAQRQRTTCVSRIKTKSLKVGTHISSQLFEVFFWIQYLEIRTDLQAVMSQGVHV